MQRLGLFVIAIALMGCGAAHKSESVGYAPAPELVTDDFAPAEPDATGDDQTAMSLSANEAAPVARADEKENTPEGPLVVYTGYLKLRVRRLMEAFDAITSATKERGGYVESLSNRTVIVRIPSGDFDAVMASFAALGELLDRRVQSVDVTAQFTDLRSRWNIAKEARARLLALLEKTTDMEERLRILQEIRRLTEVVESFEAQLSTLKNLVDYFTITIELVPILDGQAAQNHASPFPWVRGLTAHLSTLESDADDLKIDLPRDFVVFDKEHEFRAQAADTTTVRIGFAPNDPRGDSVFWMDAVDFEMNARDEQVVDRGEIDGLHYRVYQNKDLPPRSFLIGVHVYDDEVFVVEIFYPNPKTFERHHDDLLESLHTLEVDG